MVTNRGKPVFGPVDPYALLPTAALASVAVVLVLNGLVLGGSIVGLLAGVLVAFDSWANRRSR